MARPTLSLVDIKTLSTLVRDFFTHLQKLKDQDKLAQNIKEPQVPVNLSESLALYLLRKSLIIPEVAGFDFVHGLNNRDVIATKGSSKRIIEIKATGSMGWSRLSKKDVTADYLVWLDFGTFFKTRENVFDVYIISSPGNHYREKEDVQVQKIPEKTKGKFLLEKFDLDELN